MTLIYRSCNAGLCNRWFAFRSAIAMAEHLGRRAQVIWPNRTNWCAATVNELFEPDRFDILDRPWEKAVDVQGPDMTRRMLAGTFDLSNPEIIVSSYHIWGTEICGDGRHIILTPQKALRERIEEYTDKFELHTTPVLAVNVRFARAHPKSRRVKPQAYVERMHEYLAVNPDLRFFISVDSSRISRQLREAFPGRVMESPRASYRLGSRHVPPECLVDIFLMSKCAHLIGAPASTMSRMPTHITEGLELEFPNEKREDIPVLTPRSPQSCGQPDPNSKPTPSR